MWSDVYLIEIRKYKERDYSSVCEICKKTAKRGHQTQVTCWMFLEYYLDSEPEHVFVAEDKGTVVGYIVVSLNSALYSCQMKKKWIPKIQKKHWIYGLFSKACLRISQSLDKEYSGGFHMNIKEEYQHQGLGRQLLDAMKYHLHAYQKSYLYCVTENRRTRGYGFYCHYGFQEIKTYIGGAKVLLYKINLK